MTNYWSEEKEVMLRKLWPDHSGAMIARKLEEQFGESCTANMVAGKSSRLHLSDKGTSVRTLQQLQQKRAAPMPQPEHGRPPPPDGSRIIQDKSPQFISQPCSLLDLDDTRCRFPIGDPRDTEHFHYCGGATAEGRIYCPFHVRLSYGSQPTYAPTPAPDTRR